MKHPVLKFDENHKPIIEGNVEFEVGPTVCDFLSLAPKKKINFAWSVEMQQDIEDYQLNKNNEMYEVFGEQLKQDFIKLLESQKTFKAEYLEDTFKHNLTEISEDLEFVLPLDEDLDNNGKYIGNDPEILKNL
jgi:hypothetical protein